MARKTGVAGVVERPYWREAEARIVVEAWRTSGESLAQFARQERATPVLATLQRWCSATHLSEPPSTELRQAADYALNHWAALTRFVTDGRVSLDNNLCEQQVRDIALGRKNFLFAGSHEAAQRAATLYSLLRTCAQYRVPPLPYFTDVLTKLARGWDADRLDELLPHRWSAPQTSASDALPP